MLRNIILLPILLLTLFCLTCICAEQDQPPEQVAAIFKNMLTYLNEHPSLVADKSSNPSQTFQDLFNQVKEQGEKQTAASVPAVAQQAPAPVSVPAAAQPNAAHIDLSKNVVNKAAVPADIPIALAAGVPASVAAAAAIPPNHGVVNAPPAAAIEPAVAPPAPVAPAVASPAPVVPAVAPPAVVEPANKEDKGISVAAEPINNKNAAANSIEPHIEAPGVVAASIAPVTTIIRSSEAPQPSVSINPPPPSIVSSVSGSASPTLINTHTIVASTTGVPSRTMNATSSRISASSLTRSATPSATTIPPITGQASVLSVDSIGLAGIMLVSTVITMIYL